VKQGRRRAGYVFGVWGGIALASGLAPLVGYLAIDGVSPILIAVITAVGFLTALTVHLAGE
jgi:ZIP family zinc transporter